MRVVAAGHLATVFGFRGIEQEGGRAEDFLLKIRRFQGVLNKKPSALPPSCKKIANRAEAPFQGCIARPAGLMIPHIFS
jgi:hypothetical protein